jgi:hypothetical protein
VIAARRPGLDYVPAQGSAGGTLTFTPTTGGTFTRNVVSENGVISAEIAPATGS